MKNVIFSVSVPAELATPLNEFCDRFSVNRSALISRLIREYLVGTVREAVKEAGIEAPDPDDEQPEIRY